MEKLTPKVTRVPGPLTEEVNGTPMLVDEVIYLDYGEKGTTKIYIAPQKGVVDLDAVDRIIAKRGLCIDREASALAIENRRRKDLEATQSALQGA